MFLNILTFNIKFDGHSAFSMIIVLVVIISSYKITAPFFFHSDCCTSIYVPILRKRNECYDIMLCYRIGIFII